MIQCRRKEELFLLVLKTILTLCFLVLFSVGYAMAADNTGGGNTGKSSSGSSSSENNTSGKSSSGSSSVAGGASTDCQMDDKNKKSMAEKANNHLIEMKKQYDLFENKLNDVRKTPICFSPGSLDFQLGDKKTLSGKTWQAIKGYIKTRISVESIKYKYIASAITTAENELLKASNKSLGTNFTPNSSGNLTFNANDEKGASIGSDNYVKELQSNFNAVKGPLKDTQLDIKAHKNDVTEAKSAYEKNLAEKKAELAKATSATEKSEINDNINVLIGKIETLSDCLAAFNKALTPRNVFSKNRDQAHYYLTALSGEVESHCTCNAETGDLLNCEVKDDTFQEDDLVDSKCKQLTEYQADFTVCPTCGIFETILRADQDLSQGAFEKLAGSLVKLLVTAFGIFIGYQVLLLVGSPARQTVGKFLNTLMLQGFNVGLAIAILEAPSALYSNIITPLLESGFEFGLSLVPADTQNVIDSYAEKYSSFSNENELLTADFLKKMMGAVEGYNEKASLIPAIGRSLYCNAWENIVILPHFDLLIEGCTIFGFGLMIMLAIGFYLLDTAIHLGILCCLMPLLIASWPFKMTRGYTKTGWNMFLDIFFRFVMMGVILATVTELIKESLTAGVNQAELENWLNTNDTTAISKAIGISGLQMLILAVCCMISMKLVGSIQALTGRFSGGGIDTGELGAKLGGLAASTATAIAKPAALKGGKALGRAGGAMAEASGVKGLGESVKGSIQNGIKNIGGKMGVGSKAQMGAKGRDTGNKQANNPPAPNSGSGNSTGNGGGNSGGSNNNTGSSGGSGTGNTTGNSGGGGSDNTTGNSGGGDSSTPTP